MLELGINVDHVATVREVRRTYEPDPVWAAAAAELGGADCITIHLREDRRHIQDRDLRLLRETSTVKLNLEMATDDDVVDVACQVCPDQATLVPERREEVTTEGGLDIAMHRGAIEKTVTRLQEAGIHVSMFLDADQCQISAAAELGADAVELHTGQYSLARRSTVASELEKLTRAGEQICSLGMALHAGHGLNYRNVKPVARIPNMRELNIGHSIIARAFLVGMQSAVREMRGLLMEVEQERSGPTQK